MPHYSTGDRVRARVKRLLAALLAYANGEIGKIDQLEVSWLTESIDSYFLVVQTEIRFLEELTVKDKYPGKLSREQIRQVLQLLKDFLHLLEDQGLHPKRSLEWKFQLKLWSLDQTTNLSRFDQHWQNCKTGQWEESPTPEITSVNRNIAIETTSQSQDQILSVENHTQPVVEMTSTSENLEIPADSPQLIADIQSEASRWSYMVDKSLRANLSQNIPDSNVIKLVGREKELQTIHELLQQYGLVAIVPGINVGGVGKTELAIQYAVQFLEHYQGGVCWLMAKGADVGVQIVEFVRSQFPDFNFLENQTLSSKVLWCWHHWPKPDSLSQPEDPSPVLVVLDDLINYSQIRSYLPPDTSRFKVLISTRLQQEPSLQQISLGMLNPSAALELLTLRLGVESSESDLTGAEQLCEWLGYLPLSLNLVASYISLESQISLEQMLLRLQAKRLEHQVSHGDHGDTQHQVTIPEALAAAFNLTWERLEPQAQQFGILLSLFAVNPIPWSLIEQVVREFSPDGEINREALITARTTLINRCLLQCSGEEVYRLHYSIRQFFQHKLAQTEYSSNFKRMFARAIVAVARETSELPTRPAIANLLLLVPHIEELTTSLKDYLSHDDLIWPYTALGRFYAGIAPDLAESWFEQGLETVKQRLGAEHIAVATSMNNLAAIYQVQGRYHEAESLFKQALALTKGLLGETHPEVASNLNNLAYLYQIKGNYEQAELIEQEALTIWRNSLDHHPHIAFGLNNLASIYYAQGRYQEAEPLYLEALELRKRFLGEDDPSVGYSFNNLAALYYAQGRDQEAQSLYVQALDICDRSLGVDHPYTRTTRKNLALLLTKLNSHLS